MACLTVGKSSFPFRSVGVPSGWGWLAVALWPPLPFLLLASSGVLCGSPSGRGRACFPRCKNQAFNDRRGLLPSSFLPAFGGGCSVALPGGSSWGARWLSLALSVPCRWGGLLTPSGGGRLVIKQIAGGLVAGVLHKNRRNKRTLSGWWCSLSPPHWGERCRPKGLCPFPLGRCRHNCHGLPLSGLVVAGGGC